MRPLSTNEAMWLARGVALGLVLRLLRRGLRASVSRLRNIGSSRKLRHTGLAPRRLPEG